MLHLKYSRHAPSICIVSWYVYKYKFKIDYMAHKILLLV